MSTHIIFNQHEGGFFSNFNKVITHLAHTNNISRITWNLQGQRFGAFAYNCGEVFSKLFEPYDNKTTIDNNVFVNEFLQLSYTGKNTHNLYLGSKEWRYNLHNIYNKYIVPTPLLQQAIDIVDTAFKKVDSVKVGILKRNQLLKCEQINNIMPSIYDYIKIVNTIPDKKLCILSVDNSVDLNYLKYNITSKVIYSTSIRRTEKDTDMEPHFTSSSVYDAINYFIDVYMLSKCDYLIHPVSNMATAALYINPKLKSIYLQ